MTITQAPRISRAGNLLYGSAGTWSLGTPRATLAYTWWRCSGAQGLDGCRQITGANALVTPATSEMKGWYVKLRVRATHLNQAWTEVESWSNALYIP